MASEAQLLNALKNADAAGDTDAAKKLAAAVQQLRQQAPKAPAPDQPQPPKYVNPDTDGPFEGLAAAFQQGVDAPLEAMGTTAEALGAANAASALRGATSAPDGYQSATGQFMNADGPDDFAFRYLPKAVVEQTGQVAGSIASRTAGAVGGGLLGSLMGPKGTIAGTAIGAFAGPAVFEGLQILGPTAIERAKNNGRDKPTSEDWQAAYATAAASGALNAIAPNTQGILKRLLIEGTTEATQSGVQQTGETLGTDAGLQVSPKEMLGEGLLGAGAQGAVDTAIRTTKGTAAKLFSAEDGTLESPDTLPIATQQAGATFARRIDKISREGDLDGRAYDLQDLDKMSQGGARAVIEASHTDLVGEIKNQSALLREQLRPNDQDTFDQRYLKVRAAVAEKMARNKTKSVVTNENFKALEELVGGYTEGQALMNLIRESQIMTEIHNGGYQGQLSKITDKFAVFGAGLGYDKSAVAVEQVVRPIASMAFGYNTFGLSLLGQQALATIGTKIDKARGTYSSVDSYIKDNKDKTGLPAPRPPSVRAGRLQQAQAATQSSAGLEAFRRSVGGPELDNSPVGTITLGTGLDVAGLTQLLDQIESLNADNADVMDRVDQTRRNIAGENNQISDLTTWVSALNGVLNSDAALDALRSNDPDQGNARNARRSAGFGGTQGNQQQQQPQQQQQAPQGPSAAVQSGIDSNRAQLEKLRQGLAANTNLTRAERGILETALDNLEYNLGSDPAVAALDIVSRLKSAGISQGLLNNHIMPYVERVLQQQARSGRRQQPPSTGNTDLVLDQDFEAPSQPALTDNVPTGAVSGVPLENSLARSFDFAGRKVYTKGRDFKLDLQAKALASQKSAGIDLTTVTPENIDRLADFVYADALEAIKDNQNAIGWYDRTVTEALETLGEVYPEVLTNPTNKLQFVWALAVTSNGLKVDKNFELSAQVYETLQRTGRFPAKAGIGTAAKGINSGLKMYHTMLDKFDGDHVQLADFMNSQVPVRTIEKEYNVDVTGEGKGTLVRGASILGPKIGNGFFSNLYGNFDALTMDRWLMRTVGRWRGTLVVPNPAMETKKRGEIKGFINDLSTAERRVLRKLYSKTTVTIKPNMSKSQLNDFARATAKLSMDPKWREILNLLSPDIRKSGNGLNGYLDGQQEAPKGAAERDFIREVFTRALGKLQDEPAIRQNSNQQLTMSDLQALLWYPEKRLYDSAKQSEGGESRGYEDDDAPDYANAARKVVEAIKQRDGLRSSGTDGRGGRGPAGPDAGQSFDQDLAQQRGSLGALATPEPQQQFNIKSLAARMMGSQPANPAQVKAQLPEVRAVFEVGKKGTKYEDGIQDVGTALELAKALNITVKLFSDQAQMLEESGGVGQNMVRGSFARGESNQEGTVFGLKAGAASEKLGRVTDLDSLTTLLHEIGHGIAMGPSGFRNELGLSFRNEENARGNNDITGDFTTYNADSFESALMPHLGVEGAKNKDAIVKELINLQDNVEVFLENNPSGTRAVRKLSAAIKDLKDTKGVMRAHGASDSDIYTMFDAQEKKLSRHQRYVRGLREIAVDPVWVYLANPKLAKKVMPLTAKILQDQFRDAQNPRIQFYTHPFAVAFAVVLAMLANGRAEEEEEEEKRKQQMQQQGALSQQQGALSQQQAA